MLYSIGAAFEDAPMGWARLHCVRDLANTKEELTRFESEQNGLRMADGSRSLVEAETCALRRKPTEP